MCLGVPAQIVEIVDPEQALAIGQSGGIQRQFSLALIQSQGLDLKSLIGTWVIVHVGFAMAVIDEAQALDDLALLASMQEEADDA
ncbi:HypC/HybG/HupF family hydrogenase formation chaperone [Aliiglaciecola sp. CAU 1673]|uniref:HypC/HybG/HupF family hydrogenase formation chaperone n=1 Tax=Aliiglaciecola sp. CAU 1673 TaxID=3032595 RepID=UPI0023D9ED75|nr:HypC/HybG/HupF family hydrogenase formation chaperone [Aliiglaciecola sp. CAU 1673]MDF2180186.1 HypC/HybG/HupF family hydrogenase formation chaperone [Aliiglaciecola sp. CAU 1673]